MLLNTMCVDVKTPMIICEDNQSTINLVTDASAVKRTKNIAVRHHFIREFRDEGLIDIKYIPTRSQTADILTKSLGRQLFTLFRDKIVSDIDLLLR